ncbi:hypothetical protein FRB97_008407 [Tulasnella sp. 331]|nr:hypothetical protein FRB97_008407 [Tulasnella sp. 331]
MSLPTWLFPNLPEPTNIVISVMEPTSTLASAPAMTSVAVSSGSGGGGGLGSSSLYLFTFLITLILLLIVSSAVVFRSFFLRRQFRRRMEEAIAAGVLLPDGQLPPEWGGPRQRDFGEKPSMWQVSLGDLDVPRTLQKWQGLTPVSATIYRPNAISPRSQRWNPVRSGRALGLLHFFRTHIALGDDGLDVMNLRATVNSQELSAAARAPSRPTPDVAALPRAQGSVSENDNLFVSVVVAMPDARRPTYVPSTPRIDDPTSDKIPRSAVGSPSSIKGKAKLQLDSQRSSSVMEGELCDIQLGVIERSWSKEAEAIVLEGRETGGPSHAVEDHDKNSNS